MKEVRMNVPYFQVPNNIFDENMTNNEMLVYIYLCRCGNHGGTAFPSYNTIAKKCKISKRTAIDMVTGLIGKNYLQKTLRQVKPGENGSNIYTVVIPVGSATIAPPSAVIAPYKELLHKEPDKEKENGSAQKRCPSCEYTNPVDIKECITYYFSEYKRLLEREHPKLKTAQLNRVMNEIDIAISEYALDGDALQAMVDNFFRSNIGTDYNINHFATEGMLRNRMFEEAYG